jgi:FkbM family methyltransferase
MREAWVLVGPGRGHRFEVPPLSLAYRVRNRASVALGRYEPEVATFLARHLRSCRAFVDIGASTGYYTRIALTLMESDGTVVAFEPDPDAAARLRRAFSDPRLAVREEALGRDDHGAVLERRDRLASRIRDESVASSGYANGIDVRVRSLDGLVDAGEVPCPDVLKIDVEGGEILVLEGMSRLLQRRPAIAVECHSMPLLRDVLDLLIGNGYDSVEVTHGGDNIGPPTVLAATGPPIAREPRDRRPWSLLRPHPS